MTRCLLLAALACAFAARFGAGLYWEDRYAQGELYYGDSPGYWALADAIAHFQPYEYGEYGRIFRSPGYPAILAVGMRLNEWLTGCPLTYWQGRIIGVLIGVGCVWLLWRIGSLAFGTVVGLLAAFWGAIYPEFVMLSVMILADSLFCLFLLAQVYYWIKTFCRTEGRNRFGCNQGTGYSEVEKPGQVDYSGRFPFYSSLSAGVFAGLACLTRPGWLYFTPCATVFMAIVLFAFNQKDQARRQLLSGLVMTICCFAVLFPWALRNYRVSGQWIWTTCQGGPSLWDGLNPQADGSSNMIFMSKVYREVEQKAARELGRATKSRSTTQQNEFPDYSGSVDSPPANRKSERLQSQGVLRDFRMSQDEAQRQFAIEVELETNSLLTKRSFDRLRTDWRGCLHLAWIKFCRTWSPWPNQESFRSLPILLIFSGFYSLLLFFSIFGLIRARQNRDFCLLFLMIAGYFVCLHVIFVGSLRYRQPVLWCAAVFFAWGVVQAYDRWLLKSKKA